jgi:hypothetical protein
LLWAWSLPSRGTVRLRSPFLDNAEGKLRPYGLGLPRASGGAFLRLLCRR